MAEYTRRCLIRSDTDLHELLSERYPDIAFRLTFEPFVPFTLIEGNAVKHTKKKEIFLHTQEIEKEIAQFHAPSETVEVFYLYGIGLGYHYAALKEWLSERRERLLLIIEDDLGALSAWLQHVYAEEMLQDPQVHIHYLSSAEQLEDLLKELSLAFPSDFVKCAAIDSYAKRKKRLWQKMTLQLYRTTALSQALMTETLYSHKLLGNILKNVLKWPGSFFGNALKGQFKGIPAIICGAGPSLAKTITSLKELHDRALLFAGGSAISALSNHGIIPHIGMALDPNFEEFGRLKSAASFEMPLLYATRLEPTVFNTSNGERGYLLSETGGPCETHFEKSARISGEAVGPELGPEALSVTTLCVALAVEMGCDPIILNGIDLAYTNRQRYAPGVLPSSRVKIDELKKIARASERLVKRKDIFGKSTSTLIKWIMESECIAAYARQHTGHRFINATAGGIGFSGIPNQPLSEILQTSLQQPCDLSAMLHALFQKHKMHACTKEHLEKEIEEIYQSLLRLRILAKEMLEELERSKRYPTGKMTLYEYDFQEEKAFDCLFSSLGPVLENVLNRRYFLSPTLSEEEKAEMIWKRQHTKWTEWLERIESNIKLLSDQLSSSKEMSTAVSG